MYIQKRIWDYLVEKAPKYSDAEKRDIERLLISDAFTQRRYYYEGGIAPAFDKQFLGAFAIATMFELGYNVVCTKSLVLPDEYAVINAEIENNRSESIKRNQKTYKRKKEVRTCVGKEIKGMIKIQP